MNFDDNVTLLNIANSVANTGSNFIPANSTFTVKSDGSGDFTSLKDAINFINGKYSNGKVTIQLGEGTFTQQDYQDIITDTFNFSKLLIQGVSKDTTIINQSTWSFAWDRVIGVWNSGTPVEIRNLTVKGVRQDGTADMIGVAVEGGAVCSFVNVKFMDLTIGLNSGSCGNVITENVEFNNTTWGLNAQGGIITSRMASTISGTNTSTLIAVKEASMIRICRTTIQKNNVTSTLNQTANTITVNGVILQG